MSKKIGYHEFPPEDRGFFKDLSEIPFYSGGKNEIQQIVGEKVSLDDIINRIIKKGKVENTTIAEVQKHINEIFSHLTGCITQEKGKDVPGTIKVMIIEQLISIIKKIPEKVEGVSCVTLTKDKQDIINKNLYRVTINKFLTSLEDANFVFEDVINFGDKLTDKTEGPENHFKTAFKCSDIGSIKKLLTTILGMKFGDNQEFINWSLVVESLYHYIERKRPEIRLEDTLENVVLDASDKLVGEKTSIGEFLRVQNLTRKDIKVDDEILGRFHKRTVVKDANYQYDVFTIGSLGEGNFESVSVRVYTNDYKEEKTTGYVVKLRITNILDHQHPKNPKFPYSIFAEVV